MGNTKTGYTGSILGRQDSNLRMTGPKPVDLPLVDVPRVTAEIIQKQTKKINEVLELFNGFRRLLGILRPHLHGFPAHTPAISDPVTANGNQHELDGQHP